MHTNITDQQPSAAELQLSEPHFDEEATLLSARPVVPLSDIGVRGVQRPLIYGLTLIVAVIAGAYAATLVYKQGSQKPAATTVERSVPISEQAASEVISGATGVISDSPAVTSSVGENVDRVAPAEAPNPASPNPKPSFSLRADSGGEVRQRVEDHRMAREMRRAERLEAWRLRRSAEREATKETQHNGQSARDLLRIREIFEGSPRP
jgi:hypothetical protein